jgi:Phenylpropionate dioxygenase and related ring-hydroxylating dioxygenases, large terminal subunit
MSITKKRDHVGFSSQVDEWPYSSYPTGWFQIGWVDDLAPGEIKPTRYFGKDLVRFRTKSGKHHVLDAYCGHMGAHLGHGGWVEDECVVCPYHGWRWRGDGTNDYVPSEGMAIDRRRQRSWPVRVTNQIVWIWHDALGREPLWEPHAEQPEASDPSYYPVLPHCVKRYEDIGGRPQYMTENNADIEHLRWVHGARGPIELTEQNFEGPLLKASVTLTLGYGREKTRLTPDGAIDTTLDSVCQSVGAILVRTPLDGSVLFSCATPVTENTMEMYITVLVKREAGDMGDEPTGVAAARVREQFVQITRDFPIWNNQHYIKQSPLTRDEAKPMGTLRRWAAGFYPDPDSE